MKIRSTLWIAWRLLTSRKQLFSSASILGVAGLILGVAVLIVSMAVMSGFETTLKKTLSEVAGHLQVHKRGRQSENWQEFEDRLKKIDSRILTSSRFLSLEAILAYKGALSGVMIQGVDPDRINSVLAIKSRLISGTYNIENEIIPDKGEVCNALIGKGIAEKHQLTVGEVFKVVLPISDDLNPSLFQRRVATLRVAGILDLGKLEFDERVVITNLKIMQDLAQIGDKYQGLILRLTHPDFSREVGNKITEALGGPYWIQDWRDINENLLAAVSMERVVIFLVVLIIVIAAAFNVASSLFISVVQRYSEISILKALGYPKKSIIQIFSFQGILIGCLGLTGGTFIGWGFCYILTWMMKTWDLLPKSVYHLNSIELEIRPSDYIVISIVTLGICFIATLAPALRGSKLEPVEGLRYE